MPSSVGDISSVGVMTLDGSGVKLSLGSSGCTLSLARSQDDAVGEYNE